MERRLAAILCMDVVGYSRLMAVDEAGTLDRLKDLRGDVIDPLIASHSGRLVKLMGDGALVEYASVVDAVTCAMAIQKAVTEDQDGAPEDKRIVFRIGINLGDIIVEGDDIYGDGVNVAARIEGLAPPGGICISRTARDQVRDKLDVALEDLGEIEIKNIPRPVRIFRVPLESATTASSPAPSFSSGTSGKPSIAVLSFDNMSGDPEQEYFADGITEDIITGLSHFRELFVIARNSSFTYKGQPIQIQDVGRELGVQYIVEGSVRKARNRVRVTAQLIEAATGSHVWAERYDRELGDIFAVQDEITEAVVGTLVGRLGDLGVDSAKRKPTENLTALDHVLHARQEIHLYSPESLARAREHLNSAIELDSNYAAAHLSLAQVFWGEWWTGTMPDSPAWFTHIFEHAERALRLDDTDARVRLQMGFVDLYRRRYDEGRFHLEKALQLNPNEPMVPFCLAFLEVFEGNGGAAVDWVNRSIRMDPLGHYGYILGQAHYVDQDYEGSIAALQTVRPGMLTARAWLAACHARLGRRDEASKIANSFAALMSSTITDAGGAPPDSWRHYFAERWPFRQARDLDHLLDGMQMAGLE